MLVQHGERSLFFVRSLFFCVRTFYRKFYFFQVFWLFILATNSGIHWRIYRSLDCKESTICMPFIAAFHAIIYTLEFRSWHSSWQSNHPDDGDESMSKRKFAYYYDSKLLISARPSTLQLTNDFVPNASKRSRIRPRRPLSRHDEHHHHSTGNASHDDGPLNRGFFFLFSIIFISFERLVRLRWRQPPLPLRL